MKKSNRIFILMILPGFAGIMLFYCVPFLMSLYYAVINNMAEKKFVGLANFGAMMKDELFRLAVKNTISFIALSVPPGMLLALLLALGLKKLDRGRTLASVALMFPIVVPSGTIVYFWKILFDTNGLLNKYISKLGFAVSNPGQGRFAMAIIIFLFLWKNVGYNIVLFWAGLNWIPQTYYEQYALAGGSVFQQFWNITWIYLSPMTFLVFLMSIVNSFKVFKEIYQLYGAYPASGIYMLQHYMNNQFTAMNMQKLSAASGLIFLSVGLLLLFLFHFQKKITDTYH